MSTITVDRLKYQAMRLELMALQARRQREELAVQLIRRRQQLRWLVAGPNPAHMTIPELRAALEQLDGIEAARKAYTQRFMEQGA